jgi:hypothetical protein
MRVGLACYGDIPTGLGVLASRFERGLPVDARLRAYHPRFTTACHNPSPDDVANFLDKCDTVLFLERPLPMGLSRVAKDAGKRVVLVVMPEWLPVSSPWLGDVDQFICFTRQGLDHCCGIGVGGRTVLTPCPLDLCELPFRQRDRVDYRGVVYCDGWGGVLERKGAPVVKTVNRTGVAQPADLYADADLIVVPARFDGLGLTLLEAMACGCPVLATDAEPYQTFIRSAYGDDAAAVLLPAKMSMVQIAGQLWPAADVNPSDLADGVLAIASPRHFATRETAAEQSALVGRLSRAGRAYIEHVHGERAWDDLRKIIKDAK